MLVVQETDSLPTTWKQSFSEQSTASKGILQLKSVPFWYVLALFWFEVVLPLCGFPYGDITPSHKLN